MGLCLHPSLGGSVLIQRTLIIALFYLLCIFQEYSKKKLFFLGYSLTNLYFCTRKLEKV